MNIMKPKVTLKIPEDPITFIEICARTCYKSEDRITKDSAKKLVSSLIKRKHEAMIEHYVFIVEVPKFLYKEIFLNIRTTSSSKFKYINGTFDNERFLISASARGFKELYKATNNYGIECIIKKLSEEYEILFEDIQVGLCSENIRIIKDTSTFNNHELWVHKYLTFMIICDRGITHEIVRHRNMCSYAQESTRYVNYSKSNEINVIDLSTGFKYNLSNKCINDRQKYKIWNEAMINSEKSYMDLIKLGATPQEARSVLPNSTKTEIIWTTNLEEYVNTIIPLRTNKDAHPQMQEVANEIKRIVFYMYPQFRKKGD